MIYRPLITALILLALSAPIAISHTQTPGKLDLEVAEWTADLIGARVYTTDGKHIGELLDFSISDGRVDRIRVTTPAPLGFGPRTLEFPEGAFTILRGAVVLDLSAEALEAFPTTTPKEDNSEDK